MKILYYILFGWALLAEFSMIMRLASGNKGIDLPFVAAIIIIGWLAYWLFNKAANYSDNKNPTSKEKLE